MCFPHFNLILYYSLLFSSFFTNIELLSTMATPNLNEIHDTLVDLAYKAGEIINNALPEINDPGSKKNSMPLLHFHRFHHQLINMI